MTSLEGIQNAPSVSLVHIVNCVNLLAFDALNSPVFMNLTHLFIKEIPNLILLNLSELTHLTHLTVNETLLDDLESLRHLTKTTHLNLNNNQISSIEPLRNLC